MKSKLYVKENKIGVMKVGNVNYISLTEQTWMRIDMLLLIWDYGKDYIIKILKVSNL